MFRHLMVIVIFVFRFSFVDCRRKTAFEGTPVTVTCPNYYRIIVSQAIYADLLVGRATCSDPNAKENIVSLCEQKQTCSFTPDSNTFDSSTCDEASTRHRFLLDYTCLRDMCLVYSTYCDNGGSCLLNKIGAPYCKCQAGFGGYNCEFSDSQFSVNPCLSSSRPDCGNGQCTVNSLNQAVCQCTGSWTGDNCDVSPCRINTCNNNGTCIVKSDGITMCLCQGEWSGNDCSVSPCSINPCLNNGTCFVDDSGKAKCTCLGDYLGYYCSVSPCLNYNLCQNNGTCIANNEGKASCSCESSYKGQFCADLGNAFCSWRGRIFKFYNAGAFSAKFVIKEDGSQITLDEMFVFQVIQTIGHALILRRSTNSYGCYRFDEFQSNENQFVFNDQGFTTIPGAGDTLSQAQICTLCSSGTVYSAAGPGYSPLSPTKPYCKEPTICARPASCPAETKIDFSICPSV